MDDNIIGCYLNGRVSVHVGDLTRQPVDAIVNAANPGLLGGGGVDGAIHRAGGPEILEACQALRSTRYPQGLPTGEAAITTGGRLAARFVIHAVGPIFGRHGGDEPRLLLQCYERAMEIAKERELRTIAFPAISTGAYGYPFDDAARVVGRGLAGILDRDETMPAVRLVFTSEVLARRFVAAAGFETDVERSGE